MASPNDIVLIDHQSIDRQKWDNCIDRSPNGSICIYSWFLDILSPKWQALVLGDYLLIMPLPIQSKLGFPALLQPLFIQQLGVFGTESISPVITQQFIDHIPHTIQLVDYHFNRLNSFSETRFVQQLPNLVLPLNKPYTDLYGAYSLNLKRKLKKINEANFILSKDGDALEVVNLFKRFNRKITGAISEKWYNKLYRVIESCSARGMAEVWIVKDADDVLVAGIVLLQSVKHKRIILNLIAMSDVGREANAGAWLIDQFIQARAEDDFVFDFEGSKHKGVARFYQSFGAISETYPRYHKNWKIFRFLTLVKAIF
ncbi:MAG: hypothetical protein HXX14_12730 [Bacteroidetes bacterium]|nr:hypothetical protein [Bacteroidota bacterium]